MISAGACAIALVVVPWPASAVAAAVVGVVAWRRSATFEPRAVRARREALAADLPHLVDLMAAAVTAGAAPTQALNRATELSHPSTRQELGPCLRQVALGKDPGEVWRAVAQHPDLGRLGLALLRAQESGAPVLEVLTRLGDDLRDQLRAEAEIRVRQVEVKAAAPLGGCLLPAFVLLGVVPLIAGTVSGFLLR